MVVTFAGFNTHPGYAKGRMVNAIKAAARFIDRLPQRSAVAGDDRALRRVRAPVPAGGVGRPDERKGLIRDFDTARLTEKEALVEQIAAPCRIGDRDDGR